MITGSLLISALVLTAPYGHGSVTLQSRDQRDRLDAPSFEVASIRASSAFARSRDWRESIEPGPASLTLRNVSLKSCIRWAYNVPGYQISGPPLYDSERFDIAAKASGPAPEAQLRSMLQTLLADRFKLVLHRETKEMSVLALVAGKTPAKLKEAEGDGAPEYRRNGVILNFERAPLALLAERLSVFLQAPVLDMTGLKGHYDFKVDPSKSAPSGMDDPRRGERDMADDLKAAIRAAVQEQLGFRIESRKAPVEILVIDSAEKTPTDN